MTTQKNTSAEVPEVIALTVLLLGCMGMMYFNVQTELFKDAFMSLIGALVVKISGKKNK